MGAFFGFESLDFLVFTLTFLKDMVHWYFPHFSHSLQELFFSSIYMKRHPFKFTKSSDSWQVNFFSNLCGYSNYNHFLGKSLQDMVHWYFSFLFILLVFGKISLQIHFIVASNMELLWGHMSTGGSVVEIFWSIKAKCRLVGLLWKFLCVEIIWLI